MTSYIVDLDKQYAKSPTPDLLAKRTGLQTEFNLLSTAETAKLINCSKYYERGEKIRRHL